MIAQFARRGWLRAFEQPSALFSGVSQHRRLRVLQVWQSEHTFRRLLALAGSGVWHGRRLLWSVGFSMPRHSVYKDVA
jgi:hypothetical protein